MSKLITIDNVARIEGHASVSIYLDAKGEVEKAEYISTEPSRAFDVILRGKHASEVPVLSARICGICYSAHNICACKALENAWDTEVPEDAKKTRELILYANTLSSHALHFFFLSGPGLLIDGANTVGDLAKEHPEFVGAGLKLREVGQDITEIIAGRKVHSVISAPGGVFNFLDKERQAKISALLDQTDGPLEVLHKYTNKIVKDKRDFLKEYGVTKTHFASIKQSKRLELYDGPMELITSDGKSKTYNAADFLSIITEEERDYSYIRHPFITTMGHEKGQFRTGPLARLHRAAWADSASLKEYRKIFGDFPQAPMAYDIARMPEMYECVREMKKILKSGIGKDIKEVAKPKAAVGVAVVEAPRGTLLHSYETDANAIVKMARVIAPTTFHQGSIERSTFEAAKTVLHGKKGKVTLDDKVKIEQVIRAYDPCMSCGGATQLRVIKRNKRS
jgi:coenzyme F420-reducing hydrogenase alpha subunit